MLHPHVPEDLKHFGKHLFATFLGLLMALGLESWHQSHLHAEAARHSQAFIARELERELDSVHKCLPALDRMRKSLEARLGDRRGPAQAFLSMEDLRVSIATLRNASWEASVATQSVAHMESWRVERIANTFALQKDLEAIHAQFLQRLFALVRQAENDRGGVLLAKLPAPQARQMLGDLREAMVSLGVIRASVQGLQKAMAGALEACR